MGFFSIAAPIIGSLIGGQLEKSAASSANDFTREQLQNRHQWESEDLAKAGMNRILTTNGTPSIGGSAKAQVPDYGRAVSDGINAKNQTDLAKANVENLQEQARTQQTQQALNTASTAKIISDTINSQGANPLNKFKEKVGNNILSILDGINSDTISNTDKKIRENLANAMRRSGSGLSSSDIAKLRAQMPGYNQSSSQNSAKKIHSGEYLDQKTLKNLNTGILKGKY